MPTPHPKDAAFRYVDLFAGIGGFHAALSALGGACVYASEIDEAPAAVYAHNWHHIPHGDITLVANEDVMDVPKHDVLVGGFPCQPFSKSGKQRGMEEARGTLFWNIAKIIEKRQPTLVLLENVRNIAGPRHQHEWDVIIATLRDLGYRVSATPSVVSPHRIHPSFGGRPQIRERVLIAATKIPKGHTAPPLDPGPIDLSAALHNWDPQDWNLKRDLPLTAPSRALRAKLVLSEAETSWIEAWNEFVVLITPHLRGETLPGFPFWVDYWVDTKKLVFPRGTPQWKKDIIEKNVKFYRTHKKVLAPWLRRWNHMRDFPPSRRKLEWQAQDAPDLWSTVMHLRPSGIRAKKPTYVPAMVAITQTSIFGPQKRRLSIRECARLQGFPEWFNFGDQPDALSYKQLGNAVNVGVVYNALKAQVLRDIDLLSTHPDLIRSILGSPMSPDTALAAWTA
jgi:DNA (cytosine-5)-methyltransferase 1